MELPVYVTVEEVQRVCQALKIRDWTQLADAKVKPEEARVVLEEVNTEGMPIPLEAFATGLEVELEHGTRFARCQRHQQSSHPDGQDRPGPPQGDHGLLPAPGRGRDGGRPSQGHESQRRWPRPRINTGSC